MKQRPRLSTATYAALICVLVAIASAALGAPVSSRFVGEPVGNRCPPRTQLYEGLCFDARPRGFARGVKAAADRCAAAGGYLPSPAQLLVLPAASRRVALYSDSYLIDTRNGRLTAMTTIVDERGGRATIDEVLPTHKVLGRNAYLCAYR